MVGGPPPVELHAGFVSPIRVGLMISTVDEKSLRSVRESWVVPFLFFEGLVDDLLPREIPQSGRPIRERISPIFRRTEFCQERLGFGSDFFHKLLFLFLSVLKIFFQSSWN